MWYIKHLNQAFGLTYRTDRVRSGYYVATVGRFNSATKSFQINWMSAEAVGRGQQKLLFLTPDQAKSFKDSYPEMDQELYVSSCRPSADCVKIPVMDSNGNIRSAWVNVKKFSWVSDETVHLFKQYCPEYHDAPDLDQQNKPEAKQRKGFFD